MQSVAPFPSLCYQPIPSPWCTCPSTSLQSPAYSLQFRREVTSPQFAPPEVPRNWGHSFHPTGATSSWWRPWCRCPARRSWIPRSCWNRQSWVGTPAARQHASWACSGWCWHRSYKLGLPARYVQACRHCRWWIPLMWIEQGPPYVLPSPASYRLTCIHRWTPHGLLCFPSVGRTYTLLTYGQRT